MNAFPSSGKPIVNNYGQYCIPSVSCFLAAGRVMQLYTDALASSGKREALELSLEDRQVLSERLKDFADRHCTPDQAYKIEGKHEALFSKYKMEAASRKRAADSQVGGPSAKKAAVEPAQPSAAGAAAGTANPYQPDPTAAASGLQFLLSFTTRPLHSTQIEFGRFYHL